MAVPLWFGAWVSNGISKQKYKLSEFFLCTHTAHILGSLLDPFGNVTFLNTVLMSRNAETCGNRRLKP